MSKVTRWTVAVAAGCSVLVAACSGGGSGAEAGCTHASVPTGGPGDTGHYFPIDVGRTWTYSWVNPYDTGVGQGSQTVTIGDPTTVGGEAVAVLTSSWSKGTESGSGSEAYAVRPAGVYMVSGSDAAPPLDQALPVLVLPFPVQETDPIRAVTCRHLRFVEDGVTFDADVVESIGISLTGVSTLLPAGFFTDVAVVDTVVELTLRAPSSTTKAVIDVTDGYAPGVGLVAEYAYTYIEGVEVGIDSLELTSYAPLSIAGEPTEIPSLAVATRRSAPFAHSPEESARRVARRLLGIHR